MDVAYPRIRVCYPRYHNRSAAPYYFIQFKLRGRSVKVINLINGIYNSDLSTRTIGFISAGEYVSDSVSDFSTR